MIKYIQIFGPRCSGTNYIVALIRKNFPQIQICEKFWKHTHVTKEILEKYENPEEWLFLVIHRNIYDWVRSFYEQPHHVPPENLKDGFDGFLRKEWWCWYDEWAFYPPIGPTHHLYHKERPDDNDPSGKRHKNVIQMRNRKNELYLEIPNHVPNVYFIDYDFCRKKFDIIIKDLSKKLSIPLNKNPQNVTTYKGFQQIPYKQKKYPPLSEKNLKFINSEKNNEVETQLENSMRLNYFNFKNNKKKE